MRFQQNQRDKLKEHFKDYIFLNYAKLHVMPSCCIMQI